MTPKSAKSVRREIHSRRARTHSRTPRPDLQLVALPGERDPAEGGDEVVEEALRHEQEHGTFSGSAVTRRKSKRK